jgi:hypothetical protein
MATPVRSGRDGHAWCNIRLFPVFVTDGIAGKFEVLCDEPKEKLAHLLRNAKAGCFAEGLITQQVPLHSHIEVSGKPFHIEGVAEK